MNTSSINSLLRDHVLYRLQDKDSGAVQGFAFVKNGQDTPDNLNEIKFVPVCDDIINPVSEGGNANPFAASDLSITDHNEEGKKCFQTPNLVNQEEPPPDARETLETDLNLSQASSTNETTIEECLSQYSHTTPLLLPRQHPLEQEDTLSVKSLYLQSVMSSSSTDDISSSCSTSNLFNEVKTENMLDDQLIGSIKIEVEESDTSASSSSLSISRVTVASLAAEVVSSLKSSKSKMEEEKNYSGSGEKKISRHRAMYGKSSPALSEEAVKYFESRRNAKKEMSENDFAKLSKPFQFGWRRECVVVRGYEVGSVYYVTPPHPEVASKRIRYPSVLAKYLEDIGDKSLSMENFSYRRHFLGFGSEHEVARNPFQADSTPTSTGRTGWKYDNFYEGVTINDEIRFKCLLCGSLFTQKGNFGRHVKVYHEPDETCHKCGKEFRPIHIQDHKANCKGESKDIIEGVVKTVMKRKGEKGLPETYKKIMKELDLDKSVVIVPNNNNPSKPVARKSSPVSTIFNKESNLISVKGDGSKNIEPVNPEDKTVEVGTIKMPVSDASDKSTINPVEHSAKQTQPVKIESSAPALTEAALKREMSNIVSGVVEPSPMATLVMVSAEGTRVRMQVKVKAKLVKGMKKFGLRTGVSHESLRFLLDGKELTGEELAGGLDGAKILVESKNF